VPTSISHCLAACSKDKASLPNRFRILRASKASSPQMSSPLVSALCKTEGLQPVSVIVDRLVQNKKIIEK
jgi:hypothetical protein